MRSSFVRHLLTVPFVIGLTLGVAATGLGAGLLGSDIFSDIQPGAFYDEAVGEMNELGVIKGYENGNFGPNDYVTRGQVAVMLNRFKNELDLDNGGSSSSEDEEEESSSSSSSSSSKSSTSSSSSKSYASVGAQGGVHFTIKTFTVNETAGTATVSVVRTGGNTGAVTVEYATSDGTATAGSDYTQSTGTLSFATKETSKTFTIPIGDDSATEGSETVNITLTNPTGGAVLRSPDTAVLTIVDNETPSSSGAASSVVVQHEIKFSAHSYAVQENAGSITITVVRAGGTAPVTVNYSANNGTATAADYTLTNGTLSFAQGETAKTFTITVSDESVVDGIKTLTLLLTTPSGCAVLGTPSSAPLTLVDNETTTSGSGSLRFSTAGYSVTEGDAATILVNRVGGNTGQVTVTYSMTNGTALAASDYTATTGTITFAAGETSKSFTVQTIKDSVGAEGEETVNLILSAPTNGASLISPSNATLTISS